MDLLSAVLAVFMLYLIRGILNRKSGIELESAVFMEQSIDFYLAPYDPDSAFLPKSCIIERRLIAEGRDDFLLVKVIPSFQIRNRTIDVDEVVLAPRFQGDTLFPINTWPLHVHVCFILNQDNIRDGEVSARDLKIQYWGILLNQVGANCVRPNEIPL